jgi:tetratricopeptide (TPR) repeat protein/CRP-like cAMP-binding protein
MTTLEKSATRQLKIGEILVQADIVHEHQLPRALQMAKDRSLRIGQVLIMMRYLSADELEPILEIQKLINDGVIDGDSAIQTLKVMRRDGLPLTRAVELVHSEPAQKEQKEKQAGQLERELKQLESQPSTAQRDMVPLLTQLGDLYTELRNWQEAERCYRRAFSILEHSHGAKNVKLSPALIKLIELYMIQQRYNEAEPLCWRLVEVNQAAYGADHLEVARSLQRLARVLDAQSRYAESEQFLLSTIRIMEKQLGVDNPELKGALRHLSSFWKRKTKQAEHKKIGELLVESELLSADALTSALQESKRTNTPLGQTMVRLNIISHEVLRAGLQAQLLVQDGVVPGAVAVKALAIVGHRGITFEDALEEIGWHPDPISTGDLQSLIDTSDELMAAEKAFGASHPNVAALSMRLGELYTHARKFAYAETAYKRALTILKQGQGQTATDLATCMFNLANLYYVQKRLTEAESLHWQVLEIRKNALGDDHPEVAQSLEQVANLQQAQGNEVLAEQLRQAAALIKNKNSARRKEIAEFLKQQTLFSVLDERMIDRVSGLMEEMACGAGQVIVQDRQQPDALYVVLKGSVEISGDGGRSKYLSAGDVFGDLDYPRTETHMGAVRVPEEAHLLKLSSTTAHNLKIKFTDLRAALTDVSEQRRQGKQFDGSSTQNLGLQGNLAFFDLTTVLQTIISSRKDGFLRLTNHRKIEVATIAVKEGQIVAANYRHLTGHWAMYDLLARNDALDFIFEPSEVNVAQDQSLTSRPLMALMMEAARRADELPALIEQVGWPRVTFVRKERVLDCSGFDPDVSSVAADIWMLLDEGADNEQMAERVYADRYTFLLAMRELLTNNFIKRDVRSTGSFARLQDI